MIVFRPARWYFDHSYHAFILTQAGEFEQGVIVPATHRIDYEDAVKLVPVLEEMGLIQPRLDERLRTEDLKITHRVLDLLDKAIQ